MAKLPHRNPGGLGQALAIAAAVYLVLAVILLAFLYGIIAFVRWVIG